MFLVFAREVEESELLHRSSVVKNALEEAQVRLASVEIRPSRKALLLPLAVVASMEDMVVDDDRTPFSRAYAWYRLVKIWAGLRFDDAKGTPNRSMELRDTHMVGIIHKSITSRPKKRNATPPILCQRGGLDQPTPLPGSGWKIWNHMGMEAGMLTRDFMLPWPTMCRTGFARRMADYSTASAMSQRSLANRGPWMRVRR